MPWDSMLLAETQSRCINIDFCKCVICSPTENFNTNKRTGTLLPLSNLFRRNRQKKEIPDTKVGNLNKCLQTAITLNACCLKPAQTLSSCGLKTNNYILTSLIYIETHTIYDMKQRETSMQPERNIIYIKAESIFAILINEPHRCINSEFCMPGVWVGSTDQSLSFIKQQVSNS